MIQMMFEVEDLGLLEAPFSFNEVQANFDASIDDHYALQTNLETDNWQQSEQWVDKNDCQDISLESLCKSELFNPSLDECQDLDEFVLKDEGLQLPLSPPDSVEEGNQRNLEDTDTLIAEMEIFLREHEPKSHDNIVIDDKCNFDEIPVKNNNDNEQIANNENVKMEELSNDMLLEGVSNISSMVTDSGEHVIIIVTEAPKSPSSPSSTASVTEESSSDESVATPESSINRGCGRTGRRRGPHRVSPYHHIEDRRERKKLQNVAAARRYREKKRGEQHDVLGEEQQLMQRNAELSSKLSEMQREANTLKRLMHELGITKIPMPLTV